MKKIYALLFILITLPALAQVPDFSVTDCNNNTNSLYQVMASGKALVIASEGLDCSICMNKAPGVESFAAQNKGNIEVWGAMTFLYNNNTATCTQVGNWVSTYNWNNVFAFVDANGQWFMSGTPRYYVYDPRDTSLAYEGFSEASAFQAAQDVNNNVELEKNKVSTLSINSINGHIELKNAPAGSLKVQVVGLTGNVVRSVAVSGDQRISTSGLVPGIYLVNVLGDKGFQSVKKVYIR